MSSGLSTNINLRADKFNIFNTTGIRYNRTPGNVRFENRYKSEGIVNPLLIEDREYDRLRKGFNTNLGIECFITEKSSVTATGFLRLGDNKTITTNNTSEFDILNDVAVSRVRTETEDDTSYQFL